MSLRNVTVHAYPSKRASYERVTRRLPTVGSASSAPANSSALASYAMSTVRCVVVAR